MRWFALCLVTLSCASGRSATEAPPAAEGGPSMLDLCLAIARGDRSAEAPLARHPLVRKMADGMAPQVVFTPAEFARAAFEDRGDERFSFRRLLQNARFAPPFVEHVSRHREEMITKGMAQAVEFLDVEPDPKRVPLHFVCGGPWDAYVLIFDEPELFFDIGFYADDALDKAIPGFETILVHELWHLAFRAHRARFWPVDYTDSLDPEALFFYRTLNEGVGHYYSLHPKLFPGVSFEDLPGRSQKVFALLATQFPAYLAIQDEPERLRFLWSSHAGVPFWEKWGAVPAALMTYHLQAALGRDGVRRLLAREPFSFFLAYHREAKAHPDWPQLPEPVVESARRGLARHGRREALKARVQAHAKFPEGMDAEAATRAVLDAVDIKNAFARAHGWTEEAEVSLFDRVEIFSTQQALFQRILQIHNLPKTTPIPTKTLVAALEGRVLLAVTPTTYEAIAPEYAAQPRSWTRLMAHELIHRLHVEILSGNEEAMGPQWFYEGLAVIGAGQRLDAGLAYTSPEEALTAVADKAAPRLYRRYAAALRYFMTEAPLPELVTRAGAPDFEAWLQAL